MLKNIHVYNIFSHKKFEEAVVDIKRRLKSPAPPQSEGVENADMAKKEPGSPSRTTPAEESDLSKLP